MQKKDSNVKRHEIKFVFTNKDENKFLKSYQLKKIFPDRIVESLYYDTNDFKFFDLSEEGVTPRIKIRIRGYNNNILDNLEIKKTNDYDREKFVIKNFNFNFIKFYQHLKKIGIKEIVEEKLRVKYSRSYYYLENIGRVTFDKDIRFCIPGNANNLTVKTNHSVMEVKVKTDYFDKNKIEKFLNLKESRFSKYCTGINNIYN